MPQEIRSHGHRPQTPPAQHGGVFYVSTSHLHALPAMRTIPLLDSHGCPRRPDTIRLLRHAGLQRGPQAGHCRAIGAGGAAGPVAQGSRQFWSTMAAAKGGRAWQGGAWMPTARTPSPGCPKRYQNSRQTATRCTPRGLPATTTRACKPGGHACFTGSSIGAVGSRFHQSTWDAPTKRSSAARPAW